MKQLIALAIVLAAIPIISACEQPCIISVGVNLALSESTGNTNYAVPAYGGQINQTLLKKQRCEDIYYFIISKIINGSLQYSLSDLANITKKDNLTDLQAVFLISNYTEECLVITNMAIPSPTNHFVINITQNNTCSIRTGISLFGVPLDLSFPWWDWSGIVVGQKTCSAFNRDRWFFNYEPNGNGYLLTGLRFWVLALIIIVALIIYLVNKPIR